MIIHARSLPCGSVDVFGLLKISLPVPGCGNNGHGQRSSARFESCPVAVTLTFIAVYERKILPGAIMSIHASKASFAEFAGVPGQRKCLPVRVSDQ